MIDLRFPSLPRSIECDGHLYRLETSFRTWLSFGRELEEGRVWAGVFADEVPEGDWLPAALEFFRSENACPHDVPEADARAIDLIGDGDLLVAAFQQAYGIDLTEGDMHWHRFKALVAGLPESTKLSKVMCYRTYRKPHKSETNDDLMRRMRRMWEIPDPDAQSSRDELLEWAETALPW